MSTDGIAKLLEDMTKVMAGQAEALRAFETLTGATLAVHTAALQALFKSHPDPKAFKQAWDAEVATLWALSSSAGAMALNEHMKNMQAILQQALPGAD